MQVTDVISGAAPWTIGLVGISTIISFVLGVLLGCGPPGNGAAGWRTAMVPIGLFLNSMPYFWFALICLYVFAYLLDWFPLSGGYDCNLSSNRRAAVLHEKPPLTRFPASIHHCGDRDGRLAGGHAQQCRVCAERRLRDFCRAKGLRQGRIKNQYVARNAILPSITGFGMALGFVVGGCIVTEIVFSYPGIGASCSNR